MTGTDLTQIDGIDVMAAMTVVSEVGWDMSKWKTENHFVSWLELCRTTKSVGAKSSGKVACPPITAPSLSYGWRPVLYQGVFLGAHGAYFGLEEKYPLMKEGGTNPFVDPEGYKKFIAQKEQDFHTELAKQRVPGK